MYLITHLRPLRAVLLAATLFLPHGTHAQRFHIDSLKPAQKTPPPRMKATLHSVGPHALLFGGVSDTGSLGDTWIYHAPTNAWQKLNGTAPPARYDAVSAVVTLGTKPADSYVVVVGGRNDAGVLTSSLLWTFHMRKRVWREVRLVSSSDNHADARVLARAGAAGGGTNGNSILISHGFDGSEIVSGTYEIIFQSVERAYVRQVYPKIGKFAIGDPHPVVGASSVMTPANELIIFGGCYANGLCPNRDAWAFDLTSRQWRLLARGLAPVSNSSMSVVLPSVRQIGMDPRQTVLIWGGEANSKGLFASAKERPDGLDVSLLEIRAKRFWHERINEGQRHTLNRAGASLTPIVTDANSQISKYLVFGGRAEGGSNALVAEPMLISFDPRRLPLQAKHGHGYLASKLTIHGVLMLAAYTVVFPMGIATPRYMRFFINTRLWFPLHWVCQTVGFLLAWAGQIFAFWSEPRERSAIHAHSGIGVFLMTLTTLQVVLSLPGIRARPAAGCWRTVWNLIHRSCGCLILFTGLLNSLLGLFLIVAPVGTWLGLIVSTSISIVMVCALEMGMKFTGGRISAKYTVFDGRSEPGSERAKNLGFSDSHTASWSEGGQHSSFSGTGVSSLESQGR